MRNGKDRVGYFGAKYNGLVMTRNMAGGCKRACLELGIQELKILLIVDRVSTFYCCLFIYSIFFFLILQNVR